MQKAQALQPGVLVDLREDRWRVVRSIAHEDCASCLVVGASPSNAGVRRTVLLPFDRPVVLDARRRWRHVGRRRWVFGLRALLSADSVAGGLSGAADAALDLLDYQLEPALACASGVSRLLLADEVGLGKTIQAGLILAHLCAVRESVRALILCPAGLCRQWQTELRTRLSLDAEVVDLAALRARMRRAPPEQSPWDRPALSIASVDFVKQPEVLQGMASIRWDLLVVDEAHLSATAEERAAAVRWIARRSRRVALLTATPHPGDPAAFEALCGTGRLPGEGPILAFRRTRASLGLPASRRIRTLRVRLSAPERRMHALLRQYVTRVWRAAPREGRTDARLAMIVLAKRAASGAASLAASLERRLRWLGRPEEMEASQLLLPFGPGVEADCEATDEEPGSLLTVPGLPDAAAERRLLERALESARLAMPYDGKCRALIRFLRRAREPAIVFTEYRDTLSRLNLLLGASMRTAVIHGGMDQASRAESVDAFSRGTADVLLATDAAAHGLNLQARCRLVVDLELPWSPVRLEQRLGRVDRIGQRRAVHAMRLVARATGEEAVLARLRARVECARLAVAAAFDPIGSAADLEVGESIFSRPGRAKASASHSGKPRAAPCARASTEAGPSGEAPESLATWRVSRSDAGREEERRLRVLRELLRPGAGQLQDVAAHLDRAGPWWTIIRLRTPGAGARHAVPLPSGVLAVYRAGAVDARGAPLDQVLVPLVVRLAEGTAAFAPRASAPKEAVVTTGEAVAALALPSHPAARALDEEAARAAAEAVARVMQVLLPRLEQERARESRLAAVVEAVPTAVVEPGLFDRRALRAAQMVAGERDLLRDDTARRLAELDSETDISLASPPRLVLVAAIRTR